MRDKKYIALYERLSIEDKDVRKHDVKSESESITHQRKLLFEFVRKHPEWKELPIREFKDDGFSGTNFFRPQFVELMNEVKVGNVAVVIVKDFSRLGRDYLESGNFLDRVFPAYGVRFIAVNDGYDSNDYPGQTTSIDVSLRNIVNDMYSKDISLKCKSARRVRNKRGEYISPAAFYGYLKNPEDKHRLVVDDEAAEVVRRIFRLSADGLSTYEIAAVLNAEGVLSPFEYKKKNGIELNSEIRGEKALWNGAKIKVMIKDERYLGKMVSHRSEKLRVGSKKVIPVPKEEWIVVEGTHEPLITQELFDAANEALSKRAKRAGKKGELKRTNLFTCPYCGHRLQFSGGENCRKYLFCGFGTVNNSESCRGIKLERENVEQTVLFTINRIGSIYLEKRKKRKAKSDELSSAGRQASPETKIEALHAKVAALKADRRNAYMSYNERKLTVEEYKKISSDCNAKIQSMEQQIENLEKEAMKERARQMQERIIEKEVEENFFLETFNAEQLRNVLDAIYVSADGSIELSFCRKDIAMEL